MGISVPRVLKACASSTCAALVAFALATSAGAQTQQAASDAPSTATAPVAGADKVVQGIVASSYHADHLGGLDCSVGMDWGSFFKALKLDPPADRLKALQALKIHVHAPRSKAAEVSLKWDGPPLDGADEMTSGFKQMLGGYFQIYWPMIASSPISKTDKITKIERQADGTSKVYSDSPLGNAVFTIDQQNTPTQISFDSPVMKAAFVMHYTPSPTAALGDMQRVTGLDADEQMGATTMKMGLTLDYQKLDSWNVPDHVTLTIVGAYSIAFELTGCSALPEAK